MWWFSLIQKSMCKGCSVVQRWMDEDNSSGHRSAITREVLVVMNKRPPVFS